MKRANFQRTIFTAFALFLFSATGLAAAISAAPLSAIRFVAPVANLAVAVANAMALDEAGLAAADNGAQPPNAKSPAAVGDASGEAEEASAVTASAAVMSAGGNARGAPAGAPA